MPTLYKNKKYYIKLTRLYDPTPKIVWQGYTYFHIQTRPNGDIGVLTPHPDCIPIAWAEYCQEDMQPDGSWLCEDYLMEIKNADPL